MFDYNQSKGRVRINHGSHMLGRGTGAGGASAVYKIDNDGLPITIYLDAAEQFYQATYQYRDKIGGLIIAVDLFSDPKREKQIAVTNLGMLIKIVEAEIRSKTPAKDFAFPLAGEN